MGRASKCGERKEWGERARSEKTQLERQTDKQTDRPTDK